MKISRWKLVCALAAAGVIYSILPVGRAVPGAVVAAEPGGGGGGGGGGGRRGGGGQGAGGAVPDLRTLLVPAQSEMMLVTDRYNRDRTAVDQFYTIPSSRNLLRGGGGGGGGRGGGGGNGAGGGAGGSTSLAVERIARMKRYEMDWAAALDKVDGTKLSRQAQGELDALKARVQGNLKQLDAQAAEEAQVLKLLPFAPTLIKLEQARRHMDTMDAEKAATVLDHTVRDIAAFKAQLQAGLADPSKLGDLKLVPDTVTRAAADAEALQSTMAEWAHFYNDYDPMFTWWMPQPTKQIDAALADYATFLRNTVLPAAKDTALEEAVNIPAADAPAWSDVPDLQELLAFPQNELRNVVTQFGGGGGGGRRGGGGGRSVDQANQWLAALKQLDFDKLSRNAQVDYLHMRNNLDVEVERATTPPQQNIPHAATNEMLNGQPLRAPVGRQALVLGLKEEMIPYTPEELLTLAEKEFAWCDGELTKASKEMGLGGDEMKAIEAAKNDHVPVGKQPDMIRDIMRDDVAYLRDKDLITVPEIDYETLRMVMMTQQQQLVNPFFTGGAEISVSYPLSEMTTEQKLESMRGNNHAFAMATVHHELIPGHNLQWYLGPRYSGLRGGAIGSTPFYGEGWAVYWEITFYDLGFPKTAEDRVGFLFWRMMRCARIVFSLKYHLGEWTGAECVKYLVDRVGHEYENAAAEVTRSFNGSYPPLYQAGYLLGAIQFRYLHKDLVDDSKLMTNRQFNDAVMQQPSMPVALVRLALDKRIKLSADMPLDWKYYGELEPAK